MQTVSQKWITKHQWHMGTYVYSHFIHFKTVAIEVEIQFLSIWFMFPSLLPQFGSAFSLLKKGLSQYLCPYNECKNHWSLVMSFWLIFLIFRYKVDVNPTFSRVSISLQVIIRYERPCCIVNKSLMKVVVRHEKYLSYEKTFFDSVKCENKGEWCNIRSSGVNHK